MGSVSSKAARSLPPTRLRPGWAGARTPRPEEIGETVSHSCVDEHKSQAVKEDAKDPQFVENLFNLGQVNVQRLSVRSDSERKVGAMSQMFQSRKESETQATSHQPVPNRLTAPSLSDFLDARKTATSMAQLRDLAKIYEIDPSLLETLVHSVNTPSIADSTTRRVIENGDERIKSEALWIDSKVVS